MTATTIESRSVADRTPADQLKTAQPSAGALAEQRHQLFDPAIPPLACPAPRTTARNRQVAA